MPVYYINHRKMANKDAQMFKTFELLHKGNHPMVTACCDISGTAPDGLTNNHAYSLLNVVEVGGYKLAKLRNPWSSEGYNGKFSDKDSVWTPALLKAANHKLANDGIFYMPFHQFISPGYFRSTSVAVYNNAFTQTSYTIKQTVKQ